MNASSVYSRMDSAIDISADFFDSNNGTMTIGYAIKKGTHYSISVAFRDISSATGIIANVKSDYRPKTPIAITACTHSGSNITLASGVLEVNGDVRFISQGTAISLFLSIEYDVPEN